MPQGPMSSPLMRPFVVLALPGMYLFYKYNQYKRRRRENARRRLTERELQHLNHKIDKLLSKLEENEPELATTQEEECVICINAKATMQTSPCGHQVVCRKCFVKTIQMAVSQRLLPLRCVICRAKILRLKQTGAGPSGGGPGSPGMPTSVSGYSVASSSGTSVPASDSMYSVSSGGSSASEASLGCGSSCCQGRSCLGAYPRQPTGALRRSQQHAMKMKLQDYYAEKTSVCRLPPIREMSPHAAPRATSAPASTRIRCAQKIVTQLETVPLVGNSKNYFRTASGYEKLSTVDPDREPSRWSEKSLSKERDKQKSEELVDNKKNELAEKKLADAEKQKQQTAKELEKQAKKEMKEEKKKLKKEAKAEKKSVLGQNLKAILKSKVIRDIGTLRGGSIELESHRPNRLLATIVSAQDSVTITSGHAIAVYPTEKDIKRRWFGVLCKDYKEMKITNRVKKNEFLWEKKHDKNK